MVVMEDASGEVVRWKSKMVMECTVPQWKLEIAERLEGNAYCRERDRGR